MISLVTGLFVRPFSGISKIIYFLLIRYWSLKATSLSINLPLLRCEVEMLIVTGVGSILLSIQRLID